MEIFIQSIDPGAWNAIIKGPFVSTKEVNGELIPKGQDGKRNDKKRKVQKENWNMLEVTHEGTSNVRRARKNTLISEYEAFK